ncbi:hypothetical protein O3M35_008757 [Rhynocoris fuscipes]|uniref:Uncharacterized protein n=1 Tax=Rhynocoris fuscipes TaxID=488301 RepID=A0AAW1D7E1_9HEMI
MSVNEVIENINETSETESEEWDIIQHKDVQISGSSSDAESVEIINEEEAALLESSRFAPTRTIDSFDTTISSSNTDPSIQYVKKEEISSEESNEKVSTETISNESNREPIKALRSLRNSPRQRTYSTISEPREPILICLTLIVAGIAMLIMPEDSSQITLATTTHNVDVQDIDIANVIKELQMYRESNEHLKQQVKQLSEVVNGLKNSHFQASAEENKLKDAESNQPFFNSHPPDENQSFYNMSNDLINLLELINSIKYLPMFSNINNNGKFNHSYRKLNESLDDQLELFLKIPLHLNELTKVLEQHKTVQPFIQKWGKKLNKFSKSVEHDINKLKLKFFKHLLKSTNEMMISFYRKLCKFQIDNVITFHDCKRFQFDQTLKKNKKVNHGDKINGSVPIEDKLKKKQNKTVYNSGIKYLMKIKKNLKNKIIEENGDEKKKLKVENVTDNLNKKWPEQKFQKSHETKQKSKNNSQNFKINSESNYRSNKMLNIKSNNIKNNDFKKINSENIKIGKNVDFTLCKKDSILKCNGTNKANNWFINIGNHRSKLRSHQSKGDWLFERAKARREKNSYGGYHRQFHRKHSYSPPPVYRKPFYSRLWSESYGGLIPPIQFFRSFF